MRWSIEDCFVGQMEAMLMDMPPHVFINTEEVFSLSNFHFVDAFSFSARLATAVPTFPARTTGTLFVGLGLRPRRELGVCEVFRVRNDDIRFGWADAIVGAYAVDSLRAYSELKAWLNMTHEGLSPSLFL